jgi:hypothetical protein
LGGYAAGGSLAVSDVLIHTAVVYDDDEVGFFKAGVAGLCEFFEPLERAEKSAPVSVGNVYT